MVVSIQRNDDVAIVTLDNPPVNALNQAVRQGLWDAVATLDADANVRAAVLMAAGRTFIAGADISEFNKPATAPLLPDTVARIEGAAKPWIAAIHGVALGGGLEIALGCHYRIASPCARVGLPEVTLGLIPGAGGTVRLPRLIEVSAAVDLVTSGKPVPAREALRLGVVDALAENDLKADAIALAVSAAARPVPTPLSEREVVALPHTEDWAEYWEEMEALVTKKARGIEAPQRALACIRQSVKGDVQAAFALERETFLELRTSDQATALRHVFFAERAAAKPPEIEAHRARTLSKVAVVGGGTMGVGIAAALRDADLSVTLVERDREALERSEANLARIYNDALERGRLSPQERDARIAGVGFTTEYGDLAEVDLAIEAVFEDLEVKRAAFARLCDVMRSDAILATNTSYLDPYEIATAATQPERVIGLHFFSPANVMKLIEIVPTSITTPEVLAAAFALGKKLGKIPVLAGICDGFIGNRILKVARAQSERLLLAGAAPEDVDRAMVRFGMPMGPFAAQDLGGLDIAACQRSAARARGETPFAPIAERLCAMNRLGRKTGGGWYDYEPGDGRPLSSPIVAAIIAEEARKFSKLSLPAVGTSHARTPHESTLLGAELSELIVFPMINEGARILDEGIAKRGTDIDLVKIHGYGFPRWRGGLMHYAERRGLSPIVHRLKDTASLGLTEGPCDRLVQAAAKGGF